MSEQLIQNEPALASGQGAIEPVELVHRALSGCADAFRDLVMPHTSRLLALLTHRHRGNRADAEDVLQDTLLRAHQNLHRYDCRCDFRVWLYTIGFRISTDLFRRRQRESRRLAGRAEMMSPPQSGPCPVEQQESVQGTWNAARNVLGEYQFTVLWLSVGEELTNREIARILGRSALSIRVALHRARNKLIPSMGEATGKNSSRPARAIDVGVEVS